MAECHHVKRNCTNECMLPYAENGPCPDLTGAQLSRETCQHDSDQRSRATVLARQSMHAAAVCHNGICGPRPSKKPAYSCAAHVPQGETDVGLHILMAGLGREEQQSNAHLPAQSWHQSCPWHLHRRTLGGQQTAQVPAV